MGINSGTHKEQQRDCCKSRQGKSTYEKEILNTNINQFFTSNIAGKRQWLIRGAERKKKKKKLVTLKCSFQEKQSSMNEEIKTFSDKQSLRETITSRPAFQDMLKRIF